ncbi:MAG: hypothetical protein LUF87_06135 [Alistipes sp.]|nr:hypothetical protein [Alistipes sp.]
MKKIRLRYTVLGLIILLAAVSRLIPHPANFAPVGAMALFGAAYYSRRSLAYLIQVAAMYMSDLLINNTMYVHYFDGFVWMHPGACFTYGAMALMVLGGELVLKRVTAGRVLAASLAASVIFFAVSNFGAWVSYPMYTKDLHGLLMCYTAGIPFLKNTLMGDLFYCTVMFGGFELVQRRVPSLKPARL